MQKFSQKWTIVVFLEPVDEGFEFFWKDYPLHITLADVFAIGRSKEELSQVLADLVDNETSFSVEAGEELHWGTNGELVVVRINESEKLKQLHDKIYSSLIASGAKYNEPQYEGENYIPHCTVQKHTRLNKGDKVRITSLSLIDMFPGGDGYQRKIVKTIKLNQRQV